MTKQNLIYLLLTLLAFFLTSCQYDGIPKDRFNWDAAYSAPKYYPIGGARVDFGNAGMSSITNFDNGWGDEYGAVSSAEKYKKIPTEVFISYVSAAENKTFEGTITLPYKKIEKLFNQYIKNKKTDSGRLMVGMAPGGWIRVWAYFYTDDCLGNIEVTKTQLKGFVDPTINEEFTNKNDPYWEKWNTYWNHFGIPYEVWENNEKEYNLFFEFNNPNAEFIVEDAFYSSLDGTIHYNIINDTVIKKIKLPADLVLSWGSKKDTLTFDTHVLMPKNFSKIIESKKTNNIKLILEIEKNEQFAVLYLFANNKKDKLLRFKNEKRTKRGLGESDLCKNVEYFVK
jgi:hypothetical protein